MRKNDVQVIIFPDQLSSFAIALDAALLNCHAKLSSAGFFERRKLQKLMDEFVELKKIILTNAGQSIVITSDISTAINKWALDGEVMTVNRYALEHRDDGLFEFNPSEDDDK